MMSSSFDLSTYITSTLLSPRAPDVSAIKRQDLVKDFDEKTHANVVLLDLGVRDLEGPQVHTNSQNGNIY